ncbi:hypothetical protein [Paracidovorax avenae]|uniref:hypothetical protein n=1 Tax=Paracidovorax avenae TaxID=80867 RepID=UPI001650DD1F|nr:hypothetical protein [Paracidovorax avenae]
MRAGQPDTKAHRGHRGARRDVASRLLAGCLGGYVLAQTLPVAIVAAAAPALPREEAVLAAMQLGIAVYPVACMGAFAARSARRAWAVIGLGVLGSAALAWAML